MPEIDTSIYERQPKPLDILGTLSGVTALQGQMNQNKLFQQEYNSKLGLSQIYKDAIGPDGTIDPQKMNQLLGGPNSGNITLGLPQAIQNSQEAQKRNLEIDQSKIDLARKNVDTLGSYISPLAALGPKATVGDVMAAAAKAITVGHVKPEVISQALSDMPSDDSQIPGWLQQQQMRFMGIQEQFNALHPAPTMVNTGQQQIPVRLPQLGNPSIAGPGIQNQLPPSTAVFNQQANAPGYLGATGGGMAQPQGGAGQGGFVQSGPALGAEQAASVDASAGAQQGVSLQQRADIVPQTKSILGNLESELGSITTGPGTDTVAKYQKLLNAQLGTNIDVTGLAAREQFNKLAGMLSQAQFQQLGGTGTDKQLGSTELTSPNSELSKMGNKGIIALLKGNEDAIGVKNQAWQAYKQIHGPQSYGQFSTEFNKTYDPRVFQSQYLNADDRKKMLTGMNKTEQKTFLNAYRTALTQGWVKLPGAK